MPLYFGMATIFVPKLFFTQHSFPLTFHARGGSPQSVRQNSSSCSSVISRDPGTLPFNIVKWRTLNLGFI